MADIVLDANAVGQVVTYVAPGFLSYLGYRLRYPAPNLTAPPARCSSSRWSSAWQPNVELRLPGTRLESGELVVDDLQLTLSSLDLTKLSLMEMSEVGVYLIGVDQLHDADREQLVGELRHRAGDPEFIEDREPQFRFTHADETAAQIRVQSIVTGLCRQLGIDCGSLSWSIAPTDRR